jgi:hypothetical protein
MRDVAQTDAGTIARWVVAAAVAAYIADGTDNQAQRQMKSAWGCGRDKSGSWPPPDGDGGVILCKNDIYTMCYIYLHNIIYII